MSKNYVHNITPGLASCDQGVRTCVCHPPDLPAWLSVLHCRKYVKLFNFGGTLLISCLDIVLPQLRCLPNVIFCPSLFLPGCLIWYFLAQLPAPSTSRSSLTGGWTGTPFVYIYMLDLYINIFVYIHVFIYREAWLNTTLNATTLQTPTLVNTTALTWFCSLVEVDINMFSTI